MLYIQLYSNCQIIDFLLYAIMYCMYFLFSTLSQSLVPVPGALGIR